MKQGVLGAWFRHLGRAGKVPRPAGLLMLVDQGFPENPVHLYRDLRQSFQAKAVLQSSLVNDDLRTISHDRTAAIAALSFTPVMLGMAAMHNSNAVVFEVGLIIRVRHP